MFSSVAALFRRLSVEEKNRCGQVKVKNVLGGTLLVEQTFGLVMGVFERLQVNNG